jgi:hypothetical protein
LASVEIEFSGICFPDLGGNMNFRISAFVTFVFAVCLTILLTVSAATPVSAQGKPVFAGYRGVNIGTPTTEARTKLGEPKTKSDQQDYYVMSEGESTQILYEAGSVKAISTTYFGAGVKPPTPLEVFGVDAEVKPDGSINKMVKYPKAGFWISYIRTDGTDPMVMVTVHTLQKEQQ